MPYRDFRCRFLRDRGFDGRASTLKLSQGKDRISLFLARHGAGLSILDISDPENPRKIACAAGFGAHGVVHHGRHLFVPTDNRGFVIFEYAPETGE